MNPHGGQRVSGHPPTIGQHPQKGTNMPDLDDHDTAENRRARTADGPARRSVLRAAAGAGAAGVAATTLGGMLIPASAATRHGATARTGTPDTAHDDGASDVVLHVRDAAAGEIDVFRGTTQVRLRDRDLAARVVRASR